MQRTEQLRASGAQDDSDLIALYESRNAHAIRETQARYGTICEHLVNRILRDPQDTEECISDTMLHIWNAIPPAKPKSFRAFLVTVAKRLALNRLEQRQAVKRGGTAQDVSLDTPPDVLEASADTALAAEQRMLKDAFRRFLGSLPKQTRLIMIDRYWLMYSVSEIAEAHGISKSASK